MIARTSSMLLIGFAGCFAALGAGLDPPPAQDPSPQDPLDEAAAHAEQAYEQAVLALDAAARAAQKTAQELDQKVRSVAQDAQDILLDSAGSTPVPGTVRMLAPDRTDLEWTGLPARTPERVVLLVHGLDEPGSIWDDLAPALRSAGYAVARFDYPNDQPIAASADLLALRLLELRSRGTTRVDLVCHSMGGLIARDVLTRPTLYAGNARAQERRPEVERLILLGTPNLGSHWARARSVAEGREILLRWSQEPAELHRLLGGLVDGDGEAGDDLLPGSAFLTDLNARPLPQGVAITAVVGRLAPPVPAMDAPDWPLLTSWLTPERTERAEAAAAALRDGLGDGVVPVESARLAGIDDIVEVEANHRGMVHRVAVVERLRSLLGRDSHDPPAIAVVLDRLARPAPPAPLRQTAPQPTAFPGAAQPNP